MNHKLNLAFFEQVLISPVALFDLELKTIRSLVKDKKDARKSIGFLNSFRRLRQVHLTSRPNITKVSIKNIKSLEDIEVDVNKLNIIAGVNSVGKSTLLESIAIMPRYINQDFDPLSIPLGDDEFGIKNFKNILSSGTPVHEGASISLTYDNYNNTDIATSEKIGELTVSFRFDDQESIVKNKYTAEERDQDIQKLNHMPIKEIRVTIDQIETYKEKSADLQDFQPIQAEYSIKNEKILSSDPSPKNKGINNRVFGTNLEAKRLIKEDTNNHFLNSEDFYKRDIKYSFAGSVRTEDELEADWQNEIRLFGIDFRRGNRQYKISPHLTVTKTEGEKQNIDGFLSLEVSKYLKIITIDEVHSFVDNSGANLDEIHPELEKVFIHLTEWISSNHDMPTLIEDFKELANSSNPPREDTYILQLGLLSLSLYILGFKIEENPESANSKTWYKISPLAVFDYVYLESLMAAVKGIKGLAVEDLIKTIQELETDYFFEFENWFDIKDSKKLSNQIDEFINNKKRIMKWAGVSESYQSDYTDKFGDYPELLKEVNKLIKETSTKIKSELNQDQAFNKSSKNAENIYNNFKLKLKGLLRDSSLEMPLTYSWNTEISPLEKVGTIRDLFLMYASEATHETDNLFVPLLRETQRAKPPSIKDLFGRKNYGPRHWMDRRLFTPITNIKSSQFLGPLRDRGTSMKMFYSDNHPFTLGVEGEYTKIYLKENSQEKGMFISPEIFNPKMVEQLNKRASLFSPDDQQKQLKNALEQLGLISEKKLIDHISDWAEYMGICKKFVVVDTGDVPEIFIEDVNGKKVNINNVGIGVSQSLPVLLLCAIPSLEKGNQKRQTIIEQPELHLHPKAQAKLADYLLASSIGKGDILVETHSEYTLNKIRYRFAELPGVFSPNIYFATAEKDNKVKFELINMNKQGGLDSYPKDFFDQSQVQAMDFLDLSKKRNK